MRNEGGFWRSLARRSVMLVSALLMIVLVALTASPVYTSVPEASRSPTEPYEKLIGGIQIYMDGPEDNNFLCSTGFPAYYYVPPPRPDRPGYYVYGMITASHCGERYYLVYQPDNSEPQYYRGYVSIDPNNPRITDSAFIKTEISYSSTPTTIDDKVLYYGQEIPILGYLPHDSLEIGDILYKSGRSTGTTYGNFEGIVSFGVTDVDGEVIMVENGIKVQMYSYHGDSGGTMYLVERFGSSNYAWIVGILNGGKVERIDGIYIYYTYGSPYDDIIDELEVNGYG